MDDQSIRANGLIEGKHSPLDALARLHLTYPPVVHTLLLLVFPSSLRECKNREHLYISGS